MQIAITGHRPDSFLVSHYSQEQVARVAEDIVLRLKREYDDELIFNLGGAIGSDQWVGDACIEHGVNFRLYLPFLPQIQAKYWGSDQKKNLDIQMQKASGIDIMDLSPKPNSQSRLYMDRNMKMVDESSFTVAFWVGRKRGGTYNTIKYALSQSKFVLNAMNGLKPIFKDDLTSGWTPPSMRDLEDE